MLLLKLLGFFFFVSCNPRKTVCTFRDGKKCSFHQGLDYKMADYKVWYLAGSSYGVLC